MDSPPIWTNSVSQARGGQRRQHLFQENFRVSALPRTSIDGDSFHKQIGKPILRLNPALSMTNEN